MGIKGGGGPRGVTTAAVVVIGVVTIVGTEFEGTDLLSFLSGEMVGLFPFPPLALLPAFSRNFRKYSLAALIFLL